MVSPRSFLVTRVIWTRTRLIPVLAAHMLSCMLNERLVFPQSDLLWGLSLTDLACELHHFSHQVSKETYFPICFFRWRLCSRSCDHYTSLEVAIRMRLRQVVQIADACHQ
ncbi:hypothetical protein EI94DRAFT_859829 [Lactarius quietus]|nr:hypothetical protein EI94DRAFT_859829 [Lactarius quietus]